MNQFRKIQEICEKTIPPVVESPQPFQTQPEQDAFECGKLIGAYNLAQEILTHVYQGSTKLS